MNENNAKKAKQLGMPFGTATARLRKIVLFDLLKRYNENICFRCTKEIETVEELSLEHKKPWLDIDVELFWDTNNVTFSHLSCNSSDARRPTKGRITHGVGTYRHRKCRCDICRNAIREHQSERRERLGKR